MLFPWYSSAASHPQPHRRASKLYLTERNVTKALVAIGFGVALAALPIMAAAQTGYGVKKNAPSTSTFDRGWNHANESKDRARAGAAYVRRHSHHL
jgi:hypothetical protein